MLIPWLCLCVQSRISGGEATNRKNASRIMVGVEGGLLAMITIEWWYRSGRRGEWKVLGMFGFRLWRLYEGNDHRRKKKKGGRRS